MSRKEPLPSTASRFPTVPSVSQIAPLPENNSHGQLPMLSIDGRTMAGEMPDQTRLSVPNNTLSPVGERLERTNDLSIDS